MFLLLLHQPSLLITCHLLSSVLNGPSSPIVDFAQLHLLTNGCGWMWLTDHKGSLYSLRMSHSHIRIMPRQAGRHPDKHGHTSLAATGCDDDEGHRGGRRLGGGSWRPRTSCKIKATSLLISGHDSDNMIRSSHMHRHPSSSSSSP